MAAEHPVPWTHPSWWKLLLEVNMWMLGAARLPEALLWAPHLEEWSEVFQLWRVDVCVEGEVWLLQTQSFPCGGQKWRPLPADSNRGKREWKCWEDIPSPNFRKSCKSEWTCVRRDGIQGFLDHEEPSGGGIMLGLWLFTFGGNSRQMDMKNTFFFLNQAKYWGGERSLEKHLGPKLTKERKQKNLGGLLSRCGCVFCPHLETTTNKLRVKGKSKEQPRKRQICLDGRWVRAAVRRMMRRLLRTGRVSCVMVLVWTAAGGQSHTSETETRIPATPGSDFNKIHDRNGGKSRNMWHIYCLELSSVRC